MTDNLWPGARPATGFTLGLRSSDADWAEIIASGVAREKSAALVDLRRREGRDTSTFHGMSVKSDRTRRKMSGTMMRPPSMTSRLRDAMALYGALTRTQLAQHTGCNPKSVAALLKWDIEKGAVLVIRTDFEPMKYRMAE